jgi:hypothetical protein
LSKEKSHVGPTHRISKPTCQIQMGEEQKKAFDEIKQKVSKETLLAFPDFEKEFHV